MGLSPLSTHTAEPQRRRPSPPNPNPARFTIVRSFEALHAVVLEVHYLDCTTFEGRKILLYHRVPLETLQRADALDPHFTNTPHALHPFARFIPTPAGWNAAVAHALLLG